MHVDGVRMWRQRMERDPLLVAFAVSLLLHAGAYGLVELAKSQGWHTASLKERVQATLPEPAIVIDLDRKKEDRKTDPQEKQPPLTFVDVDPATATPDEPKDAKFYSAVSSKAANPDPQEDTAKPKIAGKQDQVVRTFDAARSKPEPPKVAPQEEAKSEPLPVAQPTPPPTPPPKPTPKPGAFAAAKPAPPAPQPEPAVQTTAEPLRPAPTPPRERIRTVAAAKAAAGLPVGEKMKQDGGVRRHGIAASLDVIGSPFGHYDALFIDAIRRNWYGIIDDQEGRGMLLNQGRVILTFRLHHDGDITDVKVLDANTGDIQALMCQKAIQVTSPFRAWPVELRRANAKDYREVRFTFYYN
jgi:hypothetical protein